MIQHKGAGEGDHQAALDTQPGEQHASEAGPPARLLDRTGSSSFHLLHIGLEFSQNLLLSHQVRLPNQALNPPLPADLKAGVSQIFLRRPIRSLQRSQAAAFHLLRRPVLRQLQRREFPA